MKGFFRLAAAVPVLKVGDPSFNADRIIEAYSEAVAAGASIVAFPELSITGYSCGDMFDQTVLIDASMNALTRVAAATRNSASAVIVGLPLRVESRLFNAAAVVMSGEIVGIAFKEYLQNYREFHEKRNFNSVREFNATSVKIAGADVPAGAGLVFDAGGAFRFGVEISEDLHAMIPPSANLAIGGAQAVFNLAAESEIVGKADFRRGLVISQSFRLSGTYVLAGAGVNESTSDVVFSGHSIIAENGRVVAQNERFLRNTSIIYADIKPAWCDRLRASWTAFNDGVQSSPCRRVEIAALPESPDLKHAAISSHPFLPADDVAESGHCHEVMEIQSAGLAKRIEHTGAKRLLIGVSGGLDSTLAMLVCAKTCDNLGLPRNFICAVTMPGFGTTERTRDNADKLSELLGAELRRIPITESVRVHFADIGHDPSNTNSVYENSQARERTQILMDLANAEGGFVVGTGDLSEIALGWSTYNGDHMSMYNVNCSVPKTLVRFLIRQHAEESEPELATVLRDIADTPVSPELLPGAQHTESIIGRYDLHDFFLYHFILYGEEPNTLAELASKAFGRNARPEEIKKALGVFLSRFVRQQFKRNAAPDGPKVGIIGLSQRGDWLCPSDASSSVWNKWLENRV